MRNLTIKRRKSFVACLGSMKVYIEDANANDQTINGVTCRKLGKLKNGEEQTFPIGEEAARIFVIADGISKGYCSEVYPLSAGVDDITLCGQNRYNPATGNAFRFDGNDNAEAVGNRNKGKVIGMVILAVALLIGLIAGVFIGIGGRLAKPQTYTTQGMSITLPAKFSKAKMDNMTVAYQTKDVAVFALREDFTLMEGLKDYSLTKYGNNVISNNKLTSAKLQYEGDLTYFTYTAKPENENFVYYAFVYKAKDAFWLIQFATKEENEATNRQQFFDWANTVTFEK